VNPLLAVLWAVWVGWIFSTVGAFGGVMAAVGHINVFGLGEYASSFGKTLKLNTLVTDSVRVSNQWLVGTSALVSSIKYATLGRIVLPLGVALGIGSLAGSILTPMLTQGKVDFRSYVGYFGIFVLALGCYLFYETTPGARAKKKTAAAAAKAFEESAKSHDASVQGKVKLVSFSFTRIVFTFYGVEFSFNPFLPVLGGFVIAAVASFLGVGGGFLLVPFLTSISQLPMYLAAGTSAFAVLVGMVTSISTFMFGGAAVHWPLVGLELVGIVAGSWIGPITAKFFSDIWLKRLFIVLALYVGIDYVLRGFFGIRLL
ncbi:MAG: sulfite exporter TauE/SafE family protein, partial [Desulfovibrionaceae bacterium]|nr:sulfite exporter TauE/SafE family protein [Desulfovibrionaceae bacterium]